MPSRREILTLARESKFSFFLQWKIWRGKVEAKEKIGRMFRNDGIKSYVWGNVAEIKTW